MSESWSILLVAHAYAPDSHAGVEVYTARLAKSLQRAGHRMAVVTARLRPGAAQYRRIREQVEGVDVEGVVQNYPYRDLPEALDDPALDRVFGAILDERRPDLVAVQSLQGLSLGFLWQARSRGIPVALHLHDGWWSCPSGGQRMREDGARCLPVDPLRCGACFDRFRHRDGPLERAARTLAAALPRRLPPDSVHRAWGRLPGGTQRLIRHANQAIARRGAPARDGEQPPSVDPRITVRQERIREALRIPALCISPSRFLAESLAEDGLRLPPLRVIGSGSPRGAERPSREPFGPLRLLFLGTWVPHKGLHVLAEALAALAPEHAARIEALAVGPRPFPAYVDRVLATAGGRLEARGPVEPNEVAALLAAADLLIIPSTWAENAPLVALEARATGTPILATDLGGLRELVEEGVDGRRFPAGDSAALGVLLTTFAMDRAALEALQRSLRPTRTIREWAEDVEACYRSVIDAPLPSPGQP